MGAKSLELLKSLDTLPSLNARLSAALSMVKTLFVLDLRPYRLIVFWAAGGTRGEQQADHPRYPPPPQRCEGCSFPLLVV